MSDFGTVVPSQVPTNIAAFVWNDGIFEGGFFSFLIIWKLLYLLWSLLRGEIISVYVISRFRKREFTITIHKMQSHKPSV